MLEVYEGKLAKARKPKKDEDKVKKRLRGEICKAKARKSTIKEKQIKEKIMRENGKTYSILLSIIF